MSRIFIIKYVPQAFLIHRSYQNFELETEQYKNKIQINKDYPQ